MQVYRGIQTVNPPLDGSVLTVGNFDGLHRAHRRLLSEAQRLAGSLGSKVVVLTFEPHPLTVVAPAKAPARLSTPEEKLELLKDAGADIIVVAESNPAFLALEPRQFVEDVLVARFRPRHIVEGPSFGFGRGRRGTPDTLQRYAAPFGCDVRIVEPVEVQLDGVAAMVSSSLIRNLLREGKSRLAADCLGRPYSLTGLVTRGAGRGRRIGFPTANIETSAGQLVPAEGVYAGHAVGPGVHRHCAISVGHTPTFGGVAEQVEAHLLDFEGDLYDSRLRIEFEEFLRPQRRFAGIDELARQLAIDVDCVREMAAGASSVGRIRRGGGLD
ncbi:MAG: bifunctional riboflavin kinase/FAD synthetase [Planctomycetota bacterium]